MTNISKQFTALSDPTRRKVFERVAKRSRSVAELAKGLNVTRPAVSQHLLVLKKAGLVAVEKRGTRRIYSLHSKGVLAMQDYLSAMWDSALIQFKQEVESTDHEQ